MILVPRSQRPGFALVLSLLLTLALMTLALGLLMAGTRERTIATALARKAQAERRAEGAVAAALATWSTRRVAGMPVGGEPRPLPGGGATAIRVDSGLYLVRGSGQVAGPSGEVVRTAVVLVRTLPSPASALPGAITAVIGVEIQGGRVDGSGVPEDGSGIGGSGDGPGILAPVVEVSTAASVTGSPPVERALAPPAPSPDPLAPPLIDEIADLRPEGRRISPGPMARGASCAPGPGNWGALDPTHPCYGLRPLIYADHDLTVAGGVGCGILVVDGDLMITDGAVLEGVVVVHGHLEIRGGTVRGAVRARSVLLVDGEVTRDGRALTGALAAPALDHPFRPASRWWVPDF